MIVMRRGSIRGIPLDFTVDTRSTLSLMSVNVAETIGRQFRCCGRPDPRPPINRDSIPNGGKVAVTSIIELPVNLELGDATETLFIKFTVINGANNVLTIGREPCHRHG